MSQEASKAKIQQLGDWVSGGCRQRFSRITKQDVVSWGLENGKAVEACKDMKSSIESNTEIPGAVLARVTKAYLMCLKQRNVDTKLGKLKETEEDKKKDDGKGKKPASPVKGVSKPAEQIQQLPPVIADSKRKDKLRDRNVSPQKGDRVTSIGTTALTPGDEPIDGPDIYYYLQDLDQPDFLIALHEEMEQPIDAIFRIVDNSDTKKKDETMNISWSILKARSKIDIEPWRKTAWLSFSYSDYKDVKDTFEVIAKKIYGLLERKKSFQTFFQGDKIIPIPIVDRKDVDLRYYHYLNTTENCKGVSCPENTLALLLEQLLKLSNQYGSTGDLIEPSMGFLRSYFDNELTAYVTKVVPKDDLDQGNSEIARNMIHTIEKDDEIYFKSLYMNSLTSLDLNPRELMEKILHLCSATKILNFTKHFPEFQNYPPNNLSSEALSLQIECLQILNTTSIPYDLLEKHLISLEFDLFFKKYQASSGNCMDLCSWSWFGTLTDSGLLQGIENEKILKPEVSHVYSPILGKLLVSCRSPGPVGCHEHHVTKAIRIRTKFGFALFNELIDASSSLSEGVSHTSGSKPKIAYDTGDKMIDMNVKESYMYPANGIIIKLNTYASGNVFYNATTKFYFNGNTLHYSSNSKRRSGATISFNDGNALSVNLQDGVLLIRFSEDSNYYTLAADGSIKCLSCEKTAFSTTADPSESRRVFLPSGVVIKHFENGKSQVFFPDGSTAKRINPSKGWISSSGNNNVDCMSTPDYVKIIGKQESYSVEHACGTLIETNAKTKAKSIVSPDFPQITFRDNGTQCVYFSPHFSVERVFQNGFTKSLKVNRSDCEIEVDSVGNIHLNLSPKGLKPSELDNRQKAQFNWIKGTLDFIDICGNQFEIRDNFMTHVKLNPADCDPSLSFGGRLMKAALAGSGRKFFSGNAPSLFAIGIDGGSHFRIQQDSEVMQSFISFSHEYEKITEEEDNLGRIIFLSCTKLYNFDRQERAVKYFQSARYDLSRGEEKEAVKLAYDKLQQGVTDRNAVEPLKELGEPNNPNSPSKLQRGKLLLGSNKLATQLEIVMKHMDKVESLSGAGCYSSTGFLQILANAKHLTKKILPSDRSERKVKKRISPYKPPKYFESPEGLSFLNSQKESVACIINIEDGERPAKKQEPISAIPVVEKETEAVVSSKSIMLAVNAPTISQEPNETVPAKQKNQSDKKNRDLDLPKSILGAKPDVIRNTNYLSRERGAQRHLNTVSTAARKKIDDCYGNNGFVLFPAVCNFGIVALNASEEKVIEMTNIGLDSARFKISQSKDSHFEVKYKHGPVAPGMSVKLLISLRANPIKKKVEEELKVISETEILTLKLSVIFEGLISLQHV